MDSTFDNSEILGIPIANMNYSEVVDQIATWAKNREHRFIGICNVHSTTSSAWTPALRKALQTSDFNTADGVPLVWMQRCLGYSQATRVYGPTLMLHALQRASQDNLRIAFYGGHEDRLPRLLDNLAGLFPSLNVVESISPPFGPISKELDSEYTNRLIDARPHIIWVGLGCPKQERWMLEHSPIIPGVMVGVGAAFDFHARAIAQAPHALQKLGLEWAYRLYREPRRLLGRYLTTNPIFMLRAAAQLLNKHVGGREYIRTSHSIPQN